MTYDHIGYLHRHFVLNYEGVNKSVREVYQSGFRTFYVLKSQTLGSNLHSVAPPRRSFRTVT